MTNENGAGKKSRQTAAFAKKKYGSFLYSEFEQFPGRSIALSWDLESDRPDTNKCLRLSISYLPHCLCNEVYARGKYGWHSSVGWQCQHGVLLWGFLVTPGRDSFQCLVALRTLVLMAQVWVVIRQVETCVFTQHQSRHDKKNEKEGKCSHLDALLAGNLLRKIPFQPEYADYWIIRFLHMIIVILVAK